MTAEKPLSESTVAILGLGLMGGSMALGLRSHCARLLGVDPDPEVIDLAKKEGLADDLSRDPAEILPLADLVILAAPIPAILSSLEALPDLHPGEAVVVDLGSTKGKIVEAMGNLPVRFSALGGHPMCGKEQGSLANADANLYREAPFALIRLPSTPAFACALAEELVGSIGARPVWLDAETHDRWVAYTSHLPYLAANALAENTPLDAHRLAGSGLRSTIRLARTPVNLMMEILFTNREHVLSALSSYRMRLERLEAELRAENWAALHESFTKGILRHQQLVPDGG